jgi:hypothetical protein
MDLPCVDLRQYDRYRVWNELEGRKAHQADDPWDLIIPGRLGFVAPYGGEFLHACTNSLITTRRVLAIDPEALVTQHGSDGQNVKFHSRHFEAVAKLMDLRRRKVLSEEQKAAQVERLKAYQFPASGSDCEASLQGEMTQGGPEVKRT